MAKQPLPKKATSKETTIATPAAATSKKKPAANDASAKESAPKEEVPVVSDPIPAPSDVAPARSAGSAPVATMSSDARAVDAVVPEADAQLKKALQPGHVDARITGNFDLLLTYVGVGASADVGVVRAGPGTIAFGIGGEYGTCASACWLVNTITPLEFSQSQVTVTGRASYHMAIGKRVDLYPMMMVGPTFARASIKLDDGSADYLGKDTAISVGAGAGVNFFFGDTFFIGAEARARFARGTYSYEVIAGNERQKLAEGSYDTWSRTGIDFVGALGARF